MFQFTTHVEKSIHFIETSPEAAPSDKSLAAWVRLQHIVEQASNSLGLYDPSTSKTLADLDVQLALKKFELQMVEWNAQHPLHAVNRKCNDICIYQAN